VSAPDFPDQPDPVAEADQLGAALRLFARMQGGYFRGLLGEGFKRREAMDLLQQWTEARIGAEDEEDE
jgi:hypothetical protein